ncbi:MAG: DUF2752 domain-containing protein [Ilumatobacteraceae bacterium]
MHVSDAHHPGDGLRPPRPWLLHRTAPLVGGALAAAGACYVALNDPGAPGSHFPACQFRSLTGLWCPGCGLTRGLHELLNGHLGAALGLNVFTPLAIVAALAGWVLWLRAAWDRPAITLPARPMRSASWVLLGLLVAYGALRNLPIEPFAALAP